MKASNKDILTVCLTAPRPTRRIRSRRGGVLLTTLAFVVVISVIMAGMATLSVSYYARAGVESDYAAALDLAEAGVNYELRKISANAGNADQAGSHSPPGVTYSLGNGTFTVYCINKDGSVPW